MTEFILDMLTLIFTISLFCVIIFVLIIYPKIKSKRISRRISNLKRS
jgi:hypothetical protein